MSRGSQSLIRTERPELLHQSRGGCADGINAAPGTDDRGIAGATSPAADRCLDRRGLMEPCCYGYSGTIGSLGHPAQKGHAQPPRRIALEHQQAHLQELAERVIFAGTATKRAPSYRGTSAVNERW